MDGLRKMDSGLYDPPLERRILVSMASPKKNGPEKQEGRKKSKKNFYF